ncbi:hypothetical protein [Pararhizobium antarcticum]|uniref:Uncharacterized protein n=1 Tax=Pararhizobium antarcticum TaxID=1798805 RepID=A0A657LTV5_9HYPH|nr:hypothetical protein [Pararhizobium antarcticum]OJF91508.1 hypothetical protein AX761_22235 [Rhizobium sp. 58]OJF94084.1 hypothetical protein AX760_20840 [Pararhizobium antarcticum]
MRFLLRVLSFLLLVTGVLVASVDAIQSVSASDVVLTPLGVALASVGPDASDTIQSLEKLQADPMPWSVASRWLLLQPAFAVLLGGAFLLWMLAYRRPAAAGRFAA